MVVELLSSCQMETCLLLLSRKYPIYHASGGNGETICLWNQVACHTLEMGSPEVLNHSYP